MAKRVCTFPDCGNPHKAHGLCSTHYAQQRRGIELRPIGGWKGLPCTGENCDRQGTTHNPRCRRCHERYRYATDLEYRERVLASSRAANRTAEQRAAATERSRRWRAANPEKARAIRERERERERQRAAEDPEYREHRNARLRERRHRAGTTYRSLRNVLYLLELQSGKCAICGEWLPEERSEVHVDHIIPTIAGGTDEIDNLQLTHARCNQRKGTS